MPSRHVIWKRRFGRFFRRPGEPRLRRVVLIYHAVDSGPSSLSRDRFAEQVDWLARNARVLGTHDLLECNDRNGLFVGLTFDDGYACVARSVAPVLRKSGMTATVFLNTACIGASTSQVSDVKKGHLPGEEFLVWSEVDALRDAGWTIGSHGVDHFDLTKLPDVEIARQLRESKADIEKRLKSACDQFAFTWGNHDRRVRDAVARSGYALAFAGVHGAIRSAGDRYAIPRIDIRSDYELDDFMAAVRGDWDYLGRIQQIRRILR